MGQEFVEPGESVCTSDHTRRMYATVVLIETLQILPIHGSRYARVIEAHADRSGTHLLPLSPPTAKRFSPRRELGANVLEHLCTGPA